MDLISDLAPLSPGLIDELEAFMAPVGEGCFPQQPLDARRLGGHQLPESPPDSGSEHPYSPETHNHPLPNLNQDYMLVHEHIPNEILQNGDYIKIYEELKSDNINDVVVLQDSNIVELGIRRQDLMEYPRYQMPELDDINAQMVLSHEPMPVYTNLAEPISKKRKRSEDASLVKCEPAALSPEAAAVRQAPSADGSEAGDDAPLQCIRFSAFQQAAWHAVYDCSLKPLPTVSYVVGADKGFNFSQIDEAFVCQKKNHFQVTCQIQMQGEPHYVKTGEGFKKVNSFCLHFYGVKAEDPSQEVRVEQSQSDRTKKPFHPVPVEIRRESTKITVGRLHFAETTNNNMRKKGRPNPEQRHFQLVVSLRAHVGGAQFVVASQASDRIIVRASNPGQFESDCSENWWQRGVSDNSVHFNGRVGINTDRPDESCVINGNLKVMGHIVHPSDARAKHNIQELDTAQQLRNVQSIRVVKFNYDPSFAQHSGLLGCDPRSAAPRLDTGVIAQEVRRVIPEAVKEAGDVTLPNGDTIDKFLVVNKDRIFMENLGAVKELCKVAGNLESRIDQLERVNRKLCRAGALRRRDSARSSASADSRNSGTSNSSKSLYSDGNISIEQIRDIARNIRRHECCHKLSHNSPKYTRKQCKNCHNNSKYAKYYNYNKTCVRYHTNKDKPSYIEKEKLPDEKIVKKDTCLWLRNEEDFDYGNTGFGICCRKKDRCGNDGELISNKFLQIVITILIFIMAVCLVVMSALYFREHQELLTMKQTRVLHDKFSNYPQYGKFSAPPHRTPPDLNRIQNLKHSQHPNVKKNAKEKGHKTTQDFTTTAPPDQPLPASAQTSRSYIENLLNTDASPAPPRLRVTATARAAELVGSGCTFTLNSDNELEAECQSSCGIEQAYESQEPLERSPEKEVNETFVGTIDNNNKLPITPVIAEKNNSVKTDNDSLQRQIINNHDEIAEESNLLFPSKNNILPNITELSRVRRGIDGHDNTISVGIIHKSTTNSSVFVESLSPHEIHRFSYTMPLSHCLRHNSVDVTFTTSILKEIRLCELHCNYESAKECSVDRERAKPLPAGDVWTSSVSLQCSMDRLLKIRGGYEPLKDLCHLTPEHNVPFVEFNIRIYRYCQT